MPSAKATRPVSSSTWEIRSQGSGNSSASSPKPGMIAVQPQSRGSHSRISTASVSPGRAPLHDTGPDTGLTWEKSRLATASMPDSS